MNALKYTEEHIKYLRKIAPGKTLPDICALFNEKFGMQKSEKAIKGVMYRKKIKSGMQGYNTRFQKGHTSWNKGKINPQKQNSGWFKPGCGAVIGTIRRHSRGLRIKVAQPNEWKPLQNYFYEKHIGPIPKGSIVIFLDNDKNNFALDNLFLVDQLLYLAAIKQGLIYSNPEATKSGLLLAEMLLNVNKRSKEKVNETTNLSE